jgi:hypothetical protein
MRLPENIKYLMSAFGVNFSKGDLRTFPSYEKSAIGHYEACTGKLTYFIDRITAGLELATF